MFRYPASMSPAAAEHPSQFPKHLLVAAVVTHLLISLTIVMEITAAQPLGADFLPMWTAARTATSDPGLVYDFGALTRRQEWLIGEFRSFRPFPYPPSALPLLLPFAGLKFSVAYAAWTGLSAAWLAWLVSRLARPHRLMALSLFIAAPLFATTALIGQSTFFIGAAMLQALLWIPRRPLLAGLLLGAAAAVKPTALLLAPIALAAGGHWRTLASSAVGGLSMGGLSLVLYGPDLWWDWLGALPRFQEVVSSLPGLAATNLSLPGLASFYGLRPELLPGVWSACGLLGAGCVIVVFRRTEALPPRLAALAGGALLCSGYSLSYDALVLAPAAVLMMVDGRGRGWTAGLLAFLGLSLIGIAPRLGCLGLLFALLALLGPTLLERSANLRSAPVKLAA